MSTVKNKNEIINENIVHLLNGNKKGITIDSYYSSIPPSIKRGPNDSKLFKDNLRFPAEKSLSEYS